jgi:ABC-type bacteriocin/lantibiotic exporter with double-glycine peptidase domain
MLLVLLLMLLLLLLLRLWLLFLLLLLVLVWLLLLLMLFCKCLRRFLCQSLKKPHTQTHTHTHSRYNKLGKLKFFPRNDPQSSWDTWEAEALAMMRLISISEEFWRETGSFVVF